MNEFVNLVFSISPGTTVVIGMSLFSKPFLWGAKFEGPEEVVSYLEVGSQSSNFMNKILNTCDSILAEGSLNDSVIGKRNSALVGLNIPSLVDEFFDCLLRGVSVGNVRLNSSNLINGGLVQSDENSIVKLSQS